MNYKNCGIMKVANQGIHPWRYFVKVRQIFIFLLVLEGFFRVDIEVYSERYKKEEFIC